MSVRHVSRFTQSFKVAPFGTLQYALVGEDNAGEQSPTASQRPEAPTPRHHTDTTHDLDTLCVVGSGLNVCPILQSDSSVLGWTGCDVPRSDATPDSQQSARSRMSATRTKSAGELSRGLDGDRRQYPRCSPTQEVKAS